MGQIVDYETFEQEVMEHIYQDDEDIIFTQAEINQQLMDWEVNDGPYGRVALADLIYEDDYSEDHEAVRYPPEDEDDLY